MTLFFLGIFCLLAEQTYLKGFLYKYFLFNCSLIWNEDFNVNLSAGRI